MENIINQDNLGIRPFPSVLIADDDLISRTILEEILTKLNFKIVSCINGTEVWNMIEKEMAPDLLLLDWNMPGMTGIEICEQLHQLYQTKQALKQKYIILITARDTEYDVIHGLDKGANDYITKPFNRGVLVSRIKLGLRTLDLQERLGQKIIELQKSNNEVQTLQGLLPICSYCKKIRTDENYWHKFEDYISSHSEIKFSHGICPECYEKHYSDLK